MKTVEYMGSTYEVPDWANYICADADGEIYVYSLEPTWSYDTYEPADWDDPGGYEKVYSVKTPTQPPLKEI